VAWRHKRSGCIDPRLLDLDTDWKWVVSFMPLQLYPQGKSVRYPSDRMLGNRTAGLDEMVNWEFLTIPGCVQPVASRSTDFSTAALLTNSNHMVYIGLLALPIGDEHDPHLHPYSNSKPYVYVSWHPPFRSFYLVDDKCNMLRNVWTTLAHEVYKPRKRNYFTFKFVFHVMLSYKLCIGVGNMQLQQTEWR
jgi:hypothetical protein